MSRRRAHVEAGVGAGLVAGLATMPDGPEKSRVIHLAAAVIGGVIGGIAPDLLEPAVSPRHRGALHSIAAGGAIGFSAFSRWHAECLEQATVCERRCAALSIESAEHRTQRLNAILWRVAAGVLIGFLAGYASHLALDAGTKAGLPLLANGL